MPRVLSPRGRGGVCRSSRRDVSPSITTPTRRTGVLGVAWLVAAGCGGAGTPSPSADPAYNVLVIDTGFDTSVAALRGKVMAGYTITCATGSQPAPPSDAAASPDAGSDASLATEKQQLLASLSQPDDSCALVPGIAAKPDPLASIAEYKTRWNAMILSSEAVDQAFTPTEQDALLTPINEELASYGYHGTSTAGTVAHENDGVRLALAERQLGSESSISQDFVCIVQSDIDDAVALLSEPDVQAAYIHQPTPQLDRELNDAMATLRIGLVNESYNQSARQTLDSLQSMNGCAAVDLSGYYDITSQLDEAQMKAENGPAVLVVQSAGNDGAEVDSGADLPTCAPDDPLHLMVGSNDLQGAHSTFSNVGACVEIYAPGESVIAPYAGGWLFPVDGTSFSSPLTVRLLTLSAARPFDPAAAKTALLAKWGTGGSVPLAQFPADLFYQPPAAATGTLLVATPTPPTMRVVRHAWRRSPFRGRPLPARLWWLGL